MNKFTKADIDAEKKTVVIDGTVYDIVPREKVDDDYYMEMPCNSNRGYVVTGNGKVSPASNYPTTSNKIFHQGRYFNTTTRAEKYAEWERLDNKIRMFVEYHNDLSNWNPSWMSETTKKYFIAFCEYRNKLIIDHNSVYLSQNKYMSKSTADKLIAHFNEEDLIKWIKGGR